MNSAFLSLTLLLIVSLNILLIFNEKSQSYSYFYLIFSFLSLVLLFCQTFYGENFAMFLYVFIFLGGFFGCFMFLFLNLKYKKNDYKKKFFGLSFKKIAIKSMLFFSVLILVFLLNSMLVEEKSSDVKYIIGKSSLKYQLNYGWQNELIFAIFSLIIIFSLFCIVNLHFQPKKIFKNRT